jgi:ATP-dependent helicase HepA
MGSFLKPQIRPMHPFLPGQRWLSETQGDLGLGQVIAVDERCVHVAFPATGETRLYALRNAPLVRVEIDPGERIRDRSGRVLTVRTREAVAGLMAYRCEDLDGISCALPESELDDHLHLNRPQHRLLSGRIDRDLWFSLRLETWLAGMRQATSPVLGLVGPRIDPLPHQLFIAAEVAGRYAPRVLLADEVGLGKTIEAGLILHRMLLTGRTSRVLILVPEPLLHQWLVEMRRRFNLRVALFDRERLAAMGDANPFQAEQRVLCSLDLLTGDLQAAQGALAGDWDLLVVDEAHHLSWSPDAFGGDTGYDLIAALAARTPGVLLLTATPEQFGRAGHFGRLRLLDPDRFEDYQTFVDEEHHYAPVAALASRLLDRAPPDGTDLGEADLGEADWALLADLVGDTRGLSPEQICERLVDRHGTGRVLFRNTRAAIPGFPGREPAACSLAMPPAYAAFAGEAGLTPEAAFGPGWADVDPRIDWLIATLRALRPTGRGKSRLVRDRSCVPDIPALPGREEAGAEPGRPDNVLLIAARPQTVLDLREALLRRAGIHAAVFHEGMEIVERDRAAAYFAAAEDGTQILLCSEIGSEGRNFQFTHHLVLFDLPLDPDLLEQRIGRLDRIGQRETVRIYIPYLREGPGETLYRWYAEGLGTLSAPCPAAPAVFAQLGSDLHAALADPSLTDALVARARDLTQRIDADLAAGRDRLLELHSHRREVSGALVEAVQRQDAERSVANWIGRLWDLFGIENEPGPGGAVVVRPGPHMLQEYFPELPEDGVTVTFDRAAALAHEDREFLTWEHPMVRGAMDLLTGSDLGTSAITLVRDPRFKPATILLEAVYIAECPAPPALEVGRFLPPTALRLVLDGTGRDLSAALPHEALRGDCLTRNRKLATAVIRSQAARLTEMLGRGGELAQTAATRLRDDAQVRMQALLGEELDRLRALAAINPLVRAEEIAYLEDRRDQLTRHLAHTYPRLDALRVIVTG